MTDRIEKTVELNAAPSRVWRAVTDHEEFGQWFRVRLDQPFELGKPSTGNITYPGYEHLVWFATVAVWEPETRFGLDWHPAAEGVEGEDQSATPATRVEFLIEPNGKGTRLTVTETGFEKLPAAGREEILKRNEGGWDIQVQNIKAHVDG